MRAIRILLSSVALCFSAAVAAQAWPAKPVKFIVPFAPGGATDIAARLLAQQLTQAWGQSVVVENRGGAGGGVGAAEAARAAPDGYTLFFPSGSVVTANQHIYRKMAYDPEKDFIPVTKVVTGAQVLVVPATSPYKTTADLIAAARARPGTITFGSAGIGSQIHLAAENFVSSAKLDAVHVPYKGEGPGLNDLVAGQVGFFLANVAGAVGFINQGRLRALGVSSTAPVPQLPGVPPIAKDLPGFENSGWFGLVAPVGTPKEIVDKVQRDARKALESTELKARFYVLGMVPVGDTPAEMGKAMAAERELWKKVVRERRIAVN